jgi:hypothetical protein
MFKNINKGPIQKPTDKNILDRQRRKSLNCIGWEVLYNNFTALDKQ